MDARALTPVLVQRIVYAAAEARSFKRAAVSMCQVGGNRVSAKTIERVATQVGEELAQLRDQPASRRPRGLTPPPPESAPALAVVQCDGGRIHTRQAGQGPGVHGQGWRETKNACLWTMTRQSFAEDPQPELPACFRDPAHVAELAEKAAPEEVRAPAAPSRVAASAAPSLAAAFVAPSLAAASAAPAPSLAPSSSSPGSARVDGRPKRLVRTCLSSMADAKTFGRQVDREARRRRFHEAAVRAFLGDGLAWNWSIWKRQFRSYVPILDFVHPLTYVYRAAFCGGRSPAEAWACYLDWAQACWSSRVGDVIAALRGWLSDHKIAVDAKLRDDHPHKPLLDAHRYLSNHQSRMDYVRYRRQGLPVTTALMESLVKQVNQRVKGTEMFWNDPHGAEAILQVRAAALCDDDRLTLYLTHRPGSPFVRRPPSQPLAA